MHVEAELYAKYADELVRFATVLVGPGHNQRLRSRPHHRF